MDLPEKAKARATQLTEGILGEIDAKATAIPNTKETTTPVPVYNTDLPNKGPNYGTDKFESIEKLHNDFNSPYFRFISDYRYRGVVNIRSTIVDGKVVTTLYVFVKVHTTPRIPHVMNPFYAMQFVPASWTEMVFGEWRYVYDTSTHLKVFPLARLKDAYPLTNNQLIEAFIKNNARYLSRNPEIIIPIVPPLLYELYMNNINDCFFEEVARSFNIKDSVGFNNSFVSRPRRAFWPEIAPILPDNLEQWIEDSLNDETKWRKMVATVDCLLEVLKANGDLDSDTEDETEMQT